MRALGDLVRLHGDYGPDTGPRRLALLRTLARTRLGDARSVLALHEELCFLRAYPDDARVLGEVVRQLESFERRADLARFRDALESSGVAGTATRYRFFQPTAAWLARRFPRELAIEWGEPEVEERLGGLAWLLATWAESCGLDDRGLPAPRVYAELAGPRRTDAAFLLERLDALTLSPELRRHLYDEIDPELVLRPGPGTPSRTRAAHPVPRVVFQAGPLRRGRPDLAREVRVPPLAVRAIPLREARALVRLTRDAMVVRARDLDAFMAADPRDARWIDCGDGLALAAFGVQPRERLLLEAVYGILMLKNGVPIGYVLASALFGSAEIAYNVFETFRGGESAWIYGRVLAAVRALLGAEAFTVPPYQLGHHNEEGLASGAWWFYAKLGFQPRDRGARGLARAEAARVRRDPAHRTSRRALERLVQHDVVLAPRAARPPGDLIGFFPSARLRARVTRMLARRREPTRAAAVDAVCDEVAARLGARAWRRWPRDERAAFERWAVVLALVEDLGRWTPRERAAAVAVVRSKGGRRESEFVRRFDAHARLRRAVCALAGVRSSV